MKIIVMLLLSILIGMIAGAALAQAIRDSNPLDGCTLEQKANVRIDAADYVMDGSNPIEAVVRARRENCK